MSVIIYKPSDILNFGKNEGFTLGKVYQYQPSYIEWAILTIDNFCIDLEAFDKLDSPTVIKYNSQSSNPESILSLKNLEFSIENLPIFLRNNDMYNELVNVQDIIEEIELLPDSVNLLNDFSFPLHTRAINSYKILKSLKE